MQRVMLRLAAVTLIAIALPQMPAAKAHVGRHIAGFDVEVGWASEPVLVGFPNAVFLAITDQSDQPVTDLGTMLKVEVSFGSEKMPALNFEPRETPGQYQAALIPTRPGSYAFRLVGTVRESKFDALFANVEKVTEPADIKFPVKDPSLGELAERIDRLGPRLDALGPRIDQARTAADAAKSSGNVNRILALIALALAAAAAGLAASGRAKRTLGRTT